MIVDTYIFCVLSTLNWKFSHQKSGIFSMFCQNLTATFSQSHPIKTELKVQLIAGLIQQKSRVLFEFALKEANVFFCLILILKSNEKKKNGNIS